MSRTMKMLLSKKPSSVLAPAPAPHFLPHRSSFFPFNWGFSGNDLSPSKDTGPWLKLIFFPPNLVSWALAFKWWVATRGLTISWQVARYPGNLQLGEAGKCAVEISNLYAWYWELVWAGNATSTFLRRKQGCGGRMRVKEIDKFSDLSVGFNA